MKAKLSLVVYVLFFFSAFFVLGFGKNQLKSSDKRILMFAINKTNNKYLKNDIKGSIKGNTIYINVPFGSNVATLKPTITFNTEKISPKSGKAQNFANTVIYTVTANDGTINKYKVVLKYNKRNLNFKVR